MSKAKYVFAVVVITSLVLAACGPTATPTPAPTPTARIVEVTKVVEKPVEKVVTATPVPTAPPPPPTATPTPLPPSPYRIAVFSDQITTNYWNYFCGTANSVWQAYVMSPQRLSLYGLSDKRFDIVPVAAADAVVPEVKQEGTKWVGTVKIKKGILWSNGKPWTAKDVAFTANTVLQLAITSANCPSTWDPDYLEKVEAVDDYTVKFIHHTRPGMARWEWGVLQGPIMNEEYWAPVVKEATKTFVTVDKAKKEEYEKERLAAIKALQAHVPQGEPLSGSFTFVKWEKGAFAENKANPTFFQKGAKIEVYKNGAYVETKTGVYEVKIGTPTGDKIVEYTQGPYASGVIYTLYGTQDAAVLALKKGEVDFMLNPLGLSRGLMDQVTNQPGINVIANSVNGFRYLAFNCRRAPMKDVAFRQAIAYLIDKEFVTKTILQGVAFPIYTEVPEANGAWYNPNVKKIGFGLDREQRLAEAIKLLEGAGYKWEGNKKPEWDKVGKVVKPSGRLLMPDGKPIPELKLLAPSAGYDPLRSTFAIWIERWANEVGIPIKANLIGFNDLITNVFDKQDFDLFILGWSLGIFPEALYNFHHSKFAGLEDNNAGGYSNPEFDKLSEQLGSCPNVAECKKLTDKLQEILAVELPYVVLFDTGIIETYRDSVKYPYTETLSGLQYLSGMPDKVQMVKK